MNHYSVFKSKTLWNVSQKCLKGENFSCVSDMIFAEKNKIKMLTKSLK